MTELMNTTRNTSTKGGFPARRALSFEHYLRACLHCGHSFRTAHYGDTHRLEFPLVRSFSRAHHRAPDCCCQVVQATKCSCPPTNYPGYLLPDELFISLRSISPTYEAFLFVLSTCSNCLLRGLCEFYFEKFFLTRTAVFLEIDFLRKPS
jgi:hypothetical protein